MVAKFFSLLLPIPLHCVFHNEARVILVKLMVDLVTALAFTKARVILVKLTVDLVTALLKTPKASIRLKEN